MARLERNRVRHAGSPLKPQRTEWLDLRETELGMQLGSFRGESGSTSARRHYTSTVESLPNSTREGGLVVLVAAHTLRGPRGDGNTRKALPACGT